jgi:hypothetical protein
VNPRSTPEAVFGGHLLNEVAAFGGDPWSSRPSRTMRPPPRKSVARPPVDSRGLNQHQRVPPPRPGASQEQPEQTVSRAKTPIRTSEDAQLVLQGEEFEEEVSSSRRRERDRCGGLHEPAHCA